MRYGATLPFYMGGTDGLRAAIDEHLEVIASIGEEKGIYEWDVINEPLLATKIMKE